MANCKLYLIRAGSGIYLYAVFPILCLAYELGRSTMEVFKRFIVYTGILFIFEHGITGQPSPDVSKDPELRTMLQTVLEQNRRLVMQNNRLQQVWLGMQQMCKGLSMSTCDCSNEGNITTKVGPWVAPVKTDTSQPLKPSVKPSFPLQVFSIDSSGIATDPTTVTISYAATPDHTTEWIGLRKNGGMWRTAGQRSSDPLNPTMFMSKIDVEQLNTMRQMFFRLYNDDESVNIRLNLTEVEIQQEQKVLPPMADLLTVNSSYVAPMDSDLNITAIVNKEARDFNELAFVEVFFTGLNTSSSPPSIFEIMNFNSEGLGLSLGRRNKTTSNMDITLRHPYVQFGGILTVRMPYRDSMTGMVEELYYGPFIKIFAPNAREVVPNNTMGIFPLSRQTIVFPPTQSMICAAMGNPRPEVSIIKLVNGGKTREIPTETVILDSYMNMKVLTLEGAQSQETEGRYLCRATNGDQTIDAPTEVVVLEPAEFDPSKTGVTKNISKVVVISCKARGKPKPELSLRLYDEHGPDLIKSGMYKVWKTDPNRLTSRVTLTISPVDDPDIHTVYCMASQGGPNGAYEVSRRIDVFPEKENNWELYRRVQESQTV